ARWTTEQVRAARFGCGAGPVAVHRHAVPAGPGPSGPARARAARGEGRERGRRRRITVDVRRLDGMAQYIYSMRSVRKAVGDKVILDNVTLAFLPGAKIGVVGPNGAGKSTVLKIMAGLDTASNGEAQLSPGYSVGILLQEPPLDDTKDVRGNVDEAVKPIRDMVNRFNEIAEKMAVEYTDAL